MKDLAQLGRVIYAASIFALGIQAFISSAVIFELEPVPSWVHQQVILANLTGFFLVAVGIGLLIKNWVRVAAVSLAAMLVLWILLLHVRMLIPNPAPDLSFVFETMALAGVAWAMPASGTESASRWSILHSEDRIGRYAFGISLVAFCAVNLIYHDLIAGMIPNWIPAHLFWAYFTGFASLAAGISILSGIWARAAFIWTGIMYVSWVFVIHIPYVATHPSSRDMWTDMFITLALAGGSWFLSGQSKRVIARRPQR